MSRAGDTEREGLVIYFEYLACSRSLASLADTLTCSRSLASLAHTNAALDFATHHAKASNEVPATWEKQPHAHLSMGGSEAGEEEGQQAGERGRGAAAAERGREARGQVAREQVVALGRARAAGAHVRQGGGLRGSDAATACLARRNGWLLRENGKGVAAESVSGNAHTEAKRGYRLHPLSLRQRGETRETATVVSLS